METVEVDPEPVRKRGRGRPPGPSKQRAVVKTEESIEESPPGEVISKYTIPQPPGAKPQQLSINVDPATFFTWWRSKLSFPTDKKSLDWVQPPEDKPQTKPRYKAYFYRKFPKIDPGLVGNKHAYIHISHQWPFMADGKPQDDWQKGMLALFGTGRYKIEIIDYYAGRSIANSEMELFDWAHNPPKLNMDMVIMESPDNKVFIQQMRARGLKLPGDEGYKRYQQSEESEDEMASATVEVMGKVLDRALDKVDRLEQNGNNHSSNGSDATTVVLQQMGALVQSVINAKSDNGGAAQIAELIKKLDGGNNRVFESIIEQMRTSFRETADKIEKQAAENVRLVRDQLAEAKAKIERLESEKHELQMRLLDGGNKKDDLFMQIENVGRIKEALGVPLRSGVVRKVEEKTDDDGGMPRWAKDIIQMAMPIFQPMIMQAMQAQAGGQTPAPNGMHVQTLQAVPTQPLQSPSAAQQPQNTQQPQQPSGSPATASAPSGALDGISAEALSIFGAEICMKIMDAYGIFINMVQVPLVEHLLNPELHGEDFAELIIDYHGEPVYKQIAAVGVEDLAGAIMTHAGVWNKVKHQVTPHYLREFTEHFVNMVKYVGDDEIVDTTITTEGEVIKPKPTEVN